MPDIDVLVVGAGATGLHAARLLERSGLVVQVLEARDRVGGRLYGEVVDGVTREYGGQWIAAYQTEVLSLADELGLELYSRHRTGNDVFLTADGPVTHLPHEWPLPEDADAALSHAFEALAALVRDIDPEAPWDHPRAAELDAMTFADWLDETVANPQARALMQLMVADAYATKPPTDFSMLLCAHLFASGTGNVDDLLDADLVLDRRIRGGFHRLTERLADELTTPVRLGVRVRAIVHTPEQVTAVTDAGDFTARTVIVAVPPNLWRQLEITPRLSDAFQTLAATATQGTVFKAQAVYPRPFWRDAGLSGTGFGPGEFIHEVYDNSPDDGTHGVLVGFIAGDHARRAAAMTQQQRAEAAAASFARYFGAQALHYDAYFDYDWSADDLTGGAYAATFPPGVICGAKREFHQTPSPITIAVSEIGGRGFGHVDGALREGRRAAEDVLRRLAPA